jgi:hypothetical protein
MTTRRRAGLPARLVASRPRMRHALEDVRAVLQNPRVARWLELTANVGEVLMFWPVALVAIAISHAVFGPVVTLAGLTVIRLTGHRPSLRALAWTAGGIYLGAILLSAAAGLGNAPSGELTMVTRNVFVLVLFAGGLASFALTFAIPSAAVLTRSLPKLTRLAAVWTEELAKCGLAGPTIGAAVVSLAAPPSTLANDDGSGKTNANALATSVGVVIGGLRADRRVRCNAADVEERSS